MSDSIPKKRTAKTPLARLRKMVEKRNADLLLKKRLSLASGIVWSLVVFGLIFAFVFLMAFFGSMGMWGRAFWIAFAVTAVLVVVAFWSVYTEVDPWEDVEPRPEQHEVVEWLERTAAAVSGIPVNPRAQLAGIVETLMSGPASIVESIKIGKRMYADDEETLKAGVALLEAVRDRLEPEQVKDYEALLLVRRLGLLRVIDLGRQVLFELTDRGRRLIGADKSEPDPGWI